MCGICGFNWADNVLIRKMTDSVKHRGPDGSGYYTDKNVSLGHRRLAIIDLSKKGKQPMSNEEGNVWVTYNGEIYNFKEIRRDLEKKGHQFQSETDTEVIVHAYEEYGFDCLKLFNGQFAFCVYDSVKKIFFLARDKVGIKPLYYFFDGKRFIFGSEIKSILETGIEGEVDINQLNYFFNYRFTPLYGTLFKGIKKVKPGNFLIFYLKSREISEQSYWDIDNFDILKKPKDFFIKNIRNLVYDSVKKRMMSDVPVGFFLSGGVDSSIVVGTASKFIADIKTFSIGFETTNELSYARKVAETFSTDHQEIHVSSADLNLLDKMVYHMEEPIGDPGFFPTLVISEKAKKKVTVVQAGEGADELFGGYDRYKFMLYGHKFSGFVPNINFNNEILRRLQLLKNKKISQQYLEVIGLFNSNEIRKMRTSRINNNFCWPKIRNLLQKIQYHDLKTLLPNDFLMKADKMSCAYALEERVPFLDHRLVEFSFKIPTNLKLRGWNEKYILKQSFKSLLPREIVKRKKHGYNVPMDYWFKGDLKEKLEGLLETNIHKLYKKEFVISLLNKFQKSGSNYKQNFYNAQKLWSILMFEMWYGRFMN